MRRLILAAAVAVLAACASSGSGSGASPRARTNSDLITAEELATVNVRDLYEAIERLRPRMLMTSRGAVSMQNPDACKQPYVYVDSQLMGELHTLRDVNLKAVREVRFLNASDATTRFGTGPCGGAIVVTTGPR